MMVTLSGKVNTKSAHDGAESGVDSKARVHAHSLMVMALRREINAEKANHRPKGGVDRESGSHSLASIKVITSDAMKAARALPRVGLPRVGLPCPLRRVSLFRLYQFCARAFP